MSPWTLRSDGIHEQEEDVGNGKDELEGEPVMVEVADEDRVEKPDTEGDLSEGGREGSSLRANPLEENDEADNVGADPAGSGHHVADGEHEIVDRECSDDLSTESDRWSFDVRFWVRRYQDKYVTFRLIKCVSLRRVNSSWDS